MNLLIWILKRAVASDCAKHGSAFRKFFKDVKKELGILGLSTQAYTQRGKFEKDVTRHNTSIEISQCCHTNLSNQ